MDLGSVRVRMVVESTDGVNSSRRMCMVTVKYRVVGSIAVEGTGSLRRQGDKSRRGQKRGKKIGEGGVMEAEGGGELQKVGWWKVRYLREIEEVRAEVSTESGIRRRLGIFVRSFWHSGERQAIIIVYPGVMRTSEAAQSCWGHREVKRDAFSEALMTLKKSSAGVNKRGCKTRLHHWVCDLGQVT